MSLLLTSSASARAAGLTASFLGTGGSAPYVYTVLPDGAGGSIDSASGLYTAPASINSDPAKQNDVIQVEDFMGATATLPILVTDPLGLVCDIIQTELGLSKGRVYIYNQKITEPTDAGLFIAIGVIQCKPFGNRNPVSTNGVTSFASVNMLATLDLNVISRDISALRRKEEVILALNSMYAQAQQEANSFYIGKLPPGGQFVNLSGIDGAAIPYRFNISVNIQYCFTKAKDVSYFDDFEDAEITTES